MPKDISAAQSHFASGIQGAGSKWEQRTQEGVGDYATNFGPYLSAQNSCATEVHRKGMGGFDALVAYAGCIRGKFRGGGG